MRTFPSWIEGFMEYTQPLPTPSLFRRWAAISIISSTLERKVWVQLYSDPLYPNTYIILTGPAGAGKTTVTHVVQRFLRDLGDHHLSSSSLTKAALIDDLKDAEKKLIRMNEDPSYVEYNFLSIVANELGVLIPAYDSDFMSALTDIWDGYGYSERRRSKDLRINMPAAQFNLLAGTTPAYLAGTLPPGAWDQGFLSRTTIVFSGESIIRPLFQINGTDEALYKSLLADLKEIAGSYGQLKFTKEAAKLLSDWHTAGGPPTPTHPKLASYCIRRTAHLAKLCMIVCASDGGKVINEAHFVKALDWLLEVESAMPDIFKAMSSGGNINEMKDCWHFAYQEFMGKKKAVPEKLLVEFLMARVPAYAVPHILQTMERAGIIESRMEPHVGKAYVPRTPN